MYDKNNFSNSIYQDIVEVKKVIRKNLKDSSTSTSDLLSNIPAEEGKFIRAAFVLIGGGFGRIEKQKLLEISAAIELFHLATLIHDDIIDETELRRGKHTIHRKYGVKSALFAGDYIFSQANILFNKNCSRESIAKVYETIKFICKSEISQYYSLYSLNSTIRDYLKRINGKCASLFSLSLSIGAWEGKADKSIAKKLEDIGYYAGMAFQLTDDLLDIVSSNEVLGKPSKNDMRQGIYTMPVIYELKMGNEKLLELLKCGEVDKAINLIRDSKGLKKARETAKKYNYKALKLINELPDLNEKEALREIIEKFTSRDF